MKYINYFILLSLLVVGFLLKDSIHISTNLLSLFASKESVEKLNIANKLGYSKEMLIAIKGLDKASKKKVRKIAKKLEKLSAIKFVQYQVAPTEALQQYYKDFYPLLAHFDDTNLSKPAVSKKLQALYDAQFTNIFYTSIDKNDPLKLFNLDIKSASTASHKSGMMTLGKYGYLIRAQTDIAPSQMGAAKILYDEIAEIVKPFDGVVVFAPFFYTVENSAAFKADVQWIVALSTIVLIFIYFLLLRNVKLLTETLVALFSSMVFGALISTIFIENFNVLSLAFGMSLTAVSIDYLLHYHFHNFYETKERVDKNVLYGFLTTISAFGIFTFIPIPLLSQISFFSLLSLSFAYVVFTFVFPYLKIKKYEDSAVVVEKRSKILPASFVFILSLLLFGYTAFNFKLDANIRNLDYQNESLRTAEKLFKDNSSQKLTPVIVQAKTKESLIAHLHTIQKDDAKSLSLASFVLDKESCEEKRKRLKEYDFTQLNKFVNEEASKIGFKKGYFKEAYKFAESPMECSLPDLNMFEIFSLSTYKSEKNWYTIALVEECKRVEKLPFVTGINVKAMFQKSAISMYESLLLFGSVVLGMIFLLLYLSVKRNFLYALNYVLFPLSFVMAILTTFVSVNIMHLFSLIILVAIGIDYGIYMSNSSKPKNTMLAISYSLLSTFAAFGVLIFSSIVALNSIGVVISLGCGAIFILIKVMR